jgi:uncharacterized cupredoxin-like copper-binding protein
MANKIQVRRGLRAHLPTLSVGELGFCTDTKELFVGSNSGNVAIANLDHVHDFTHDHHELYYQKSEVDQKLATKSNIDHTHTGYASQTYVDTELDKKSDIGHTHTDKADKTYVDTELAKKVSATTFNGHTGNTVMHVTQTEKDAWNAKAEVSQLHTHTNKAVLDNTEQSFTTALKTKLDGLSNYTHPSTHPASMITGLAAVATSGSYSDLSNKPSIPTKLSQLELDISVGGIIVGTTKPTDGSMWYEIVG